MANVLIKSAVRSVFLLTRKEAATRGIRRHTESYLRLAERCGGRGVVPVRVPRMTGVDEDMREWSFFMLLEHQVIVNGIIRGVVKDLAAGKSPDPNRVKDPKKHVMPSASAGVEQIEAFATSVEQYLGMVESLQDLRGTPESEHPVFGFFDAHRWHCMFGFHLKIHLKQARHIVAHADGSVAQQAAG